MGRLSRWEGRLFWIFVRGKAAAGQIVRKTISADSARRPAEGGRSAAGSRGLQGVGRPAGPAPRSGAVGGHRPPKPSAGRLPCGLKPAVCRGLPGEVAGPFWQVCGEGGAQPQPPGGRLTAAEGRQDRPGGAIGLRPGFRPAQTLHGEPQNARTVLLLQKCGLPFNFRGIFPLHCLKQPRKRKKEFSFLRFLL